jgi:hypothetical protein
MIQVSKVDFGPMAPHLEAFLGQVGALLADQRWAIARRRNADHSNRHLLLEQARAAAQAADRPTHRAESWARGAAASGIPFNMSGRELVAIQEAAAESAVALVVWDLLPLVAAELFSIMEPEITAGQRGQ